MNDPAPTTNDRETFTDTPRADRPPTAEEEVAAERAAADVDMEAVAGHYEEAIRTGAAVRGEGEIEPEAD